MKKLFIKSVVAVWAVVTLTVFSGRTFATDAPTGADLVEVYLNNKLIKRYAAYNPVELKELSLSEANANDDLVVKFRACHPTDKAQTNRRITITDADGKTLKEWSFNDGDGATASVVIPVKELLALMKNKSDGLALLYRSNEIPQNKKSNAVTTSDKPKA